MKKRFYFLIFLSLLFASCNNDDDKGEDLAFEKDAYSVMENFATDIFILSGNADYNIVIADETIISASYANSKESSLPSNLIHILGKKKGSTTMTVTDNVSKQSATLSITVTNPYISMKASFFQRIIEGDAETIDAVGKDIDQRNWLSGTQQIISLINNEAKTMYIFASDDEMSKGISKYKGTYEIKVIEEIPYLSLTFKSGDLTEDLALEHKYEIEVNQALNILYQHLGLAPGLPKNTSPEPYFIPLKEDLKEFYLPDYPRLTSANVYILTKLLDPSLAEIPNSLLK